MTSPNPPFDGKPSQSLLRIDSDADVDPLLRAGKEVVDGAAERVSKANKDVCLANGVTGLSVADDVTRDVQVICELALREAKLDSLRCYIGLHATSFPDSF